MTTSSGGSSSSDQWVWAHLRLPRPLEPELVEQVLVRFAADHAGPTLVLEARVENGALVDFLIGVPATHVRPIYRTLRDMLPGLELDGVAVEDEHPRYPVEHVERLRVRPRSLALATDRAEATSIVLLSALHAHLRPKERLVIQIMLGPRQAPTQVSPQVEDPRRSWWQDLAGELFDTPTLAAPKLVHDQIQARAGQHGFAALIRVGASALTTQRTKQLITGVLGALSTVAGPDTYLDFEPEAPERLNEALAPRWWHNWGVNWDRSGWDITLGACEVSSLLAWPYGERDLPGVMPLHPRPLRVPVNVSRSERVFAVPAAPGLTMPIGIAANDIVHHCHIVGPTGVGKTNVMLHLAAADITAGRPVIVLDPKNQLVDDILDCAVPSERRADVVVIDPADATTPTGEVGQVVGLNPFDLGDRDPDVVADSLVAVLAGTFADGWGPRSEDIFHSGIASLARVGAQRVRAGHGQPFTLLDLPRLWVDEGFRRSVVMHIANDPGLASFWAWYEALSLAARANALAAPGNKLRRILNRPSLRAILGQPQPTFRLRDAFRDNRVLLVPLNEALIGPSTAQLLGSLISAEIWNATLERATENDPVKRPASVMIDEVQRFLHLPVAIEDALARSRSLGVGWHLAHQFRTQIPASTRAAVDSNAKSKIIFRPLDPDDARDIAKQAPELTARDFTALGKHQAYVNLAVEGEPSGWALTKTLPPPTPTGLGPSVRAASRENYAATPSTATPARELAVGTAAITATPHATETESPIGRKRRQP